MCLAGLRAEKCQVSSAIHMSSASMYAGPSHGPDHPWPLDLVYTPPMPTTLAQLETFWSNTCQCRSGNGCTCGLLNKSELLHSVPFRLPQSDVCRHDFLTVQPYEWLNDAVIADFCRVLNLRQRRLEADGYQVPLVLYLGPQFYHKMLWDATTVPGITYSNVSAVGIVRNLQRAAACSRCVLQQELIITVVHVGGNHWICVALDLRSSEIFCLDPLKVSC